MKAFRLGIGIQIIAAFIVAVIIFVVFLIGFELPKLAQLTRLRIEKQEEEKKITEKKDKLEELKAVKREMIDVEFKKAELEKKMPQKAELPQLINDMQSIANQEGVEIASIKPGEIVGFKEYSEIPIETRVNSRFFELVRYMDRLQNMKRELKITTISIEEADDGELPDLSTTLNLSAYTFAKGKQVTKTEEKSGKSSESSDSGSSGSGTSQQPSSSP